MSLSNWRRLAFALAFGAVAGPVFADERSSPDVNIGEEIQTLKTRIEQLETEQKAQEAAQHRATVDGVLKDADRHSQYRDEVGGETEAPRFGKCQHLRSELPHQLLLDLNLCPAFADQATDEHALAVGLRRIGDVERDATDDAHHLVLDIGKRRLGSGGARGRCKSDEDRDRCRDCARGRCCEPHSHDSAGCGPGGNGRPRPAGLHKDDRTRADEGDRPELWLRQPQQDVVVTTDELDEQPLGTGEDQIDRE